MPLSSGSRLGPYEIVAPLGAGGMGEVYRARDIRLKRDVAVKVLPAEFAGDPERLARFRREAELLAALNHLNIAGIYGLEEIDGGIAIAMELVEGESLAERLVRVKSDTTGASTAKSVVSGFSRTGMAVDDAIPIARQIIDALDAAHDKGIVHRDLKPGNIMLTHEGQVKVLDFGLARMEAGGAGQAGRPGEVTHSPTLTFAGTQVGLILGTAAYMSPEQAKGRVADKRCDVWAFGCVLYEMLTGRRAFDGEDISEVLASVLKSDPDWTAFPDDVPAHLQTIVKRCLAKDRKARIPDMSVVRFLFDDAGAATQSPSEPSASRRASAIAWKAATAIFVLTTAALAAWHFSRPVDTPRVSRFFVYPPEKTRLENVDRTRSAVISPDGRMLVFGARNDGGAASLWIRKIDSFVAQPLAGTDGASAPFWSPDSRFVAFFARGKLLKIDTTGGNAQALCETAPGTGTWSGDGGIIFAETSQGALRDSLQRVAANGGRPEPLAQGKALEQKRRLPSFLPDGRHFLYLASTATTGAAIYVASLEGGEPKRLVAAETAGRYAAPGYLLFVRQGTLVAQRFDAATLELAGDPIPVAENVAATVFSDPDFSVSQNGVLAYSTSATAADATEMVWLDRAGKVIETAAPPANYLGVDIAPDGKRIATHRHEGAGGDVWLIDPARGPTRFTFDASQENSAPVWSPDGSRIAFTSLRDGKWGLYQKAPNGAGAEELILEPGVKTIPIGWSPDGRSLLYLVYESKTGSDVWMVSLNGERKATALVRTPANEAHSQVSPDGRWLAYGSNESGQSEVYVSPFPSGAGKWLVSNGGIQPRWRADGHELFYVKSATGELAMMAVDARASGSAFEAGAPRTLFSGGGRFPGGHTTGANYHSYAVSPDGQRFLTVRLAGSTQASATMPIAIVINWAEGLRK